MEQRRCTAVLAGQFGDPPFALVLADGTANRLRIGPAAAGELCDRAGFPIFVQDVVADNFERVGDAVRGVTGAKRESADIDGTRSLNERLRISRTEYPHRIYASVEHRHGENAAACVLYIYVQRDGACKDRDHPEKLLGERPAAMGGRRVQD